ncbi:MAG TPA: MmcQ/YjbR family DNA-binding protein [Vicinamibacterales bacterium]|nr:MmcQ/YjbR family DNA-binding protein [Vicinamibacterales bacterium]
MKTKGLTFDAVREIGLSLPRTEEGTAWGTPVLRVDGRIFTGIPIHKSAEPNSLMIHVDAAVRDEMIAEQPELYYTAAHYENYPCVLVRLSKLRRDVLEDLLRMSHQFVTQRRSRAARRPRARVRAPRP